MEDDDDLTGRNCPSDSHNSYPFVNAGEVNEIPSVDQHVYSPDVVAEPLVEPSPQSLVGVTPDTSGFGQPLSDVVPGSPDISNYGDYSNIFSEGSKLDACLSSQGTPAADHPHCLNQSSPAHPCQPVHPSPLGSIGLLEEDIAYQETRSPSLENGSTPQITGFSTAIVPTKDVNQSSHSPLGGNVSLLSDAFSVHDNSAKEKQPFDEDAFVAGFLNDNEETDDTDNSKPDDDVENGSTPQITGFPTAIVPMKDVNQSSHSPLGGNVSLLSDAFSVHDNSAKEKQPFDEDAFVAGFLNDNEETDDTDNSKPDDDVLNSGWFRRKF